MDCPVIMTLGIMVADILLTCGNELNQNTLYLVILMTRRAGICWNGSILYIARTLSFTVRIYLSIFNVTHMFIPSSGVENNTIIRKISS
jgi:hypothetical protein